MIREAKRRDADAIADVHVTTWQAAYRDVMPDEFLDTLSVAGRAMQWDGILQNPEPRSQAFVAEEDGEIVGFVHCGACRDDDIQEFDAGEVYAIYVHPDRWGEGIGSDLLRRAVEFLEEADYDFAALWVLAENRGSRDFYEKAGFIPDGTEKVEEQGGRDLVHVRYRAMLA